MNESKPVSWSDIEARSLLQLVLQVPRRLSRLGTSFLRPRRISILQGRRRSSALTLASSTATMRFTNPFFRASQDETTERGALFAERDQEPFQETLYFDLEKSEIPFIKSARSSVSSFVHEHLHLGGGGDQSWMHGLFWLLSRLRPLLFALLPSFFLDPINFFFFSRSRKRPAPKKRLSPTAYLDGLRGVAAFVVYIFHYSYLWYPSLRNGYACDNNNTWFWQMSVVRVLHSGRASVTVFFVISGYVLTVKTLKMIHSRQTEKALSSLAGSAFRRPLRLYLPITASTFMIAIMIRYQLYIRDPSGAITPPVATNLHDQLHHWFWEWVGFINPFKSFTRRDNVRGMLYDGHLWTIPVEMKGSLLVFMLLLMFSRARTWIRMATTVVFIQWLITLGDWDQALFLAGLLLAEISVILPPSRPSTAAEQCPGELPRFNVRAARRVIGQGFRLFRHAVTVSLFFVSCHMMSYPESRGPATPGFRRMSQRVPAYYAGREDRIQLHWIAVGSVLLILSLMYSPAVSFNVRAWLKCRLMGQAWYQTSPELGETEKEEMEAASSAATAPRAAADGSQQSPMDDSEPLLQRLFTCRFSQYLGHISYSLYLWHGTVNHTVGVRWLVPAWGVLMQAQVTATKLPAGTAPEAAVAIMNEAWDNYSVAFFWGTFINTLVLFWVSDVFNRLIDIPAVKLTRWAGEKCFKKE